MQTQTQTQTAPVTFPVQYGIPAPFDIDGEQTPLIWVDATVDPARYVYAPDDSPVPVRIDLYSFVLAGGKVARPTAHYISPATIRDVLSGNIGFDDPELNLAERLERCAVPHSDVATDPELLPKNALAVVFYRNLNGQPDFLLEFTGAEFLS